MSKNLITLLKSFGVENADDLAQYLLTDEDAADQLQSVLKAAQNYARPFIEGEFNEKLKAERGQLKGKYMKETLLKANKAFGNPLTNKEVDDILADPANEGKTIDAAIDALRDKVEAKASAAGKTDAEIQKMLDAANGKIAEYETKFEQEQARWKDEAQKEINRFKRDGVLSSKLMDLLSERVENPGKVAELLKAPLHSRAEIRLKDDGSIGLFDPANPDVPLKKNETTLQTFDGLVTDLVSEFGLEKKSQGTQRRQVAGGGDPAPNEQKAGSGLAAKLGQVLAS